VLYADGKEVLNMTTALPPDFESFTHFMEHRYRNGAPSTLEEGIQAFREYQRQLTELRAQVQEARDQVARGEYGPLDEAKLIREIDERLSEKGIPE
jgi:hypothetical protein